MLLASRWGQVAGVIVGRGGGPPWYRPEDRRAARANWSCSYRYDGIVASCSYTATPLVVRTTGKQDTEQPGHNSITTTCCTVSFH